MIQYKTKHLSVFESALFRTNSTVIHLEDLILVVDPTWLPAEIEEICHFVDTIKNGRPVYLLFTHSDYDHILGFGAFPDAFIIASQAFMDNPDKMTPIQEIQNFDEAYYVRRPYNIVYPRVDMAIDPSTEFITIGDTRLSFWQAPGHNADGLFTLVEPLGIWLVGDYLSNEEFPFIYHSAAAYLHTLEIAEEIIKTRHPEVLIPGHGDVCTEPGEMISRLDDSRKYIHDLKKAIVSGNPFPEEKLWEQYDFRLGQEDFHRKNVELMRKEFLEEGAKGQKEEAKGSGELLVD